MKQRVALLLFITIFIFWISDFDDDDNDDESSEDKEDKSEKESSNEEGNEEKKEASESESESESEPESGKNESGSNTETGDEKSKQEVARVKRENEVCFSKIEILIHFLLCHYCQSCIFYQTIQRDLSFDRKRSNAMITVFSKKKWRREIKLKNEYVEGRVRDRVSYGKFSIKVIGTLSRAFWYQI